MKDPNLPAATLCVSRWSTTCNNCGLAADPHSKTHDRVLGYSEALRGTSACGVEWTHIYSVYMGELEERLTRELRPDLEFIPLKWEAAQSGTK